VSGAYFHVFYLNKKLTFLPDNFLRKPSLYFRQYITPPTEYKNMHVNQFL